MLDVYITLATIYTVAFIGMIIMVKMKGSSAIAYMIYVFFVCCLMTIFLISYGFQRSLH